MHKMETSHRDKDEDIEILKIDLRKANEEID